MFRKALADCFYEALILIIYVCFLVYACEIDERRFLVVLVLVYDRKRSLSNSSYTQNNDCSLHPRENSPDAIGAEMFFKMEKKGFLYIGSVHSEMSMKFVKKKKKKSSHFSANL